MLTEYEIELLRLSKQEMAARYRELLAQRAADKKAAADTAD